MKPVDSLSWLRAIIAEAEPEDRAPLEATLAAVESAQRHREAAVLLEDAAAELEEAKSLAAAGDPAYLSEDMAEATKVEAATAAAVALLHRRVAEWRVSRAALWRTAALLAAHEGYRDVRELAESEGPGAWEYRAVTATLESEGRSDPLAASVLTDDGKRGQYAGELLAWGRKVGRELFAGAPPATEAEARATVDTKHGPALRWDAAFAVLLDRMGGATGRELADDVRVAAAKRTAAVRSDNPTPAGDLWGLWADLERGQNHTPRWLGLLADALWADTWRPALVRERRPVALPVTGLLSVVTGALAGVDVQPGADGRRMLVDRNGRAVGRFEGPRLATAVQAEALEALALAGVRELRSVAAMRFVPWFAHAVQRRPDEAVPLVFEGADGVNAYGIVAAAMGMDPDKHAGEVRGLLHALNCAILSYPDGGEAGVLMLDYRPGGGRGNPSRLTLTPGRPWLAGDVFELPEGSAYRALAAIPKLPDLAPPFVGDRRERGALGRLWLRILAELAREAPDLARGLGAHIPGARWAEIASEEGLLRPPPLLIPLVQDRWVRDGDDGPAVFERVGPERWHLAPAFAAEREMLEAGGKARIGASKGGQLAAKARSEARGRLADGKGRKGKR